MKDTLLFVYLYCALLLILSACTADQQEKTAATPPEAALTQRLQEVLSADELMGLSVLVVDGGEVIYERGFGLADAAAQRPATAHSIYRVASISKAATATALMLLYDEGKIDLDRDVSDYLDFQLRHPGYPDKPITLRMLLSHQSSLHDGEGYFNFSRAMFGKALHLRELFVPGGQYYTEDLWLDHEPGAFFTYANCPWGIVAAVVERVGGQRFDRFCAERLFAPLGMDAAFNVRQLQHFDSLAVLYRYEDGAWQAQADDYGGQRPEPLVAEDYELGSNGLLFGPQGSLRTSVHDLAKFMLLHLNDGATADRPLLQPATVRLMHDNHWTYDGRNGDTYHDFFFSWGLGFHRITHRDSMDVVFPDTDMIGHPGEAYGLISDMYFDRAKGRGVIFVTNGSKKDFAAGERTTFYRPEEATFAAVYDYLQALEKSDY